MSGFIFGALLTRSTPTRRVTFNPQSLLVVMKLGEGHARGVVTAGQNGQRGLEVYVVDLCLPQSSVVNVDNFVMVMVLRL